MTKNHTIVPLRQHAQAVAAMLQRADTAWLLLIGGTLLYILIFATAAIYKLHSFWMGFDLGVHEQVLWNTIHGHIAAVSPKEATQSYFGVDVIIVELLLAPLYALVPRTETMLVLQVVLASSGTIPLYLIAIDRSRQPVYGLLAALLYLGSLPVQYALLYEFQIRTVGTMLFLWAFLFFERKNFRLFLVAGILAIWTRSDGSFALAAMGVYALLHRRRWYWSVVPMAVGFGWVVLCLKWLIPAFREDHGFLYSFVYAWLGDTPLEMVQTLLLRPGYVAQHVFTPEKMLYVLELFGPLLFLPLLRPDIVLIALPSLMQNLLSPEHIHWSIRYHYQAFVVPFLLVATVYAVTKKDDEEESGTSFCLWYRRFQHIAAILLVVATFASQVVIRTPLIHLITRERDSERIAFAEYMMQQVPDDAALSTTSAFGSRMARRHEIYFFPGNIIYPPEFSERGEYLLADLHEVPPEDMPRLRRLQQSPNWRTLIDQDEFVLLERVH